MHVWFCFLYPIFPRKFDGWVYPTKSGRFELFEPHPLTLLKDGYKEPLFEPLDKFPETKPN